MNTAANELFNKIFATTSLELVYDEGWENGTGYYDHAVKKVKLLPGQVARSVSKNDRKILFVGTIYGTCVVFQRYSSGDRGILVHNMPKAVSSLFFFEAVLTAADLTSIFDIEGGMNIGVRLENLRNDPLFCAEANRV